MLKTACSALIVLIVAGAATARAHADTVRTRIFRVEEPLVSGQDYEVLATSDGRVYSVPAAERALVARLTELAARGIPVRLELDATGDRVLEASVLEGEEAREYSDDFDEPAVSEEARDVLGAAGGSYAEGMGAPAGFDAPASAGRAPMPASFGRARALGFEPSVLASMDQAQELFRSQRRLKGKSQCYERAHVWAREMEQSRGVRSMKVFMFFTSRFRHRFRTQVLFWDKPYRWWFHVAPFVYVGGQEVVLDPAFLGKAVPMEDWTFEFIGKVKHSHRDKIPNPTRGEARCQDAALYEEYSKHERNPARYCVLRKVPMHFFQPLDIEASDAGRVTPREWRDWELKKAYRNTAL